MTDEHDESLIRHEEAFRIGRRLHEIGVLRLSTSVTSEAVEGAFERESEDAEIAREHVDGPDSGQIETLSDGSVSIPIFEEELVVSRRLVVRERIVIRKHTVSTTERIRDEVRREDVQIERLEPSEGDRS